MQLYSILFARLADEAWDDLRRVLRCHSERSEESLIIWLDSARKQPEMFESLASCFAFRCSASLNMTNGAIAKIFCEIFYSRVDSTGRDSKIDTLESLQS